MKTAGEKFQQLVGIMARLRAPDGCPWDREQTFDSIKPYTLEETYEVLDAIDRRNWNELAEELGDFLLQAVKASRRVGGTPGGPPQAGREAWPEACPTHACPFCCDRYFRRSSRLWASSTRTLNSSNSVGV